MGGSGQYGLTGVFGACQDQAKTTAANIEHLSTVTTVLTDFVSKMKTDTNNIFFLVGNKLQDIEKAQQQMTDTQNRNWQIFEERFETINENFHIMRDCTQLLFSNQQLNFNFDTTASLLTLLYADVKSYSYLYLQD